MTITKHSFMKRIFVSMLAFFVAVSIFCGTFTIANAEEEKPTTPIKKIDVPLEDGLYRTEIDVWNAYQDQASMGNQSLRGSESFAQKHPEDSYQKAFVIVENNKATALLEFMPMGFIGKYGFMLEIDGVNAEYLQQWGGIYEKTTTYTKGQALTKHLTDDGKAVYDPYNDPSSNEVFNGNPDKHTLPEGFGRPAGSVLNISDKPYNHLIAVDCTPIVKGDAPVPTKAEEYNVENSGYIHIFVPVMYTIMPTSGDQYARLKVDWVNAEKVENPNEVLEYQLWKASNIKKACFTEVSYQKLQDTIKSVSDKLNKIWPNQNIQMDGTGFNAQPKLEQKEFTDKEKAEMAKALTDAILGLEKEKADYTAVNNAIAKIPADLSVYTEETSKAVNDARNAIDMNQSIDNQTAVDKMAADLEKALSELKLKDIYVFDKNKLANGIYSIHIEMFKMNRKDLSMSDKAIGHTAKLVVKDGEYTLFINFKGINYLNQFGYLGNLCYYDEGFTFDNSGNISGEKIPATIITTQKNADGTDVIDDFNKDGGVFAGNKYPETVSIKIVRSALADSNGFVPAHSFVPVMESIAENTGNQDVLIKLDWASLKETTDDDPAFIPEKPEKLSPEVDLTDEQTGLNLKADEGVFEEGAELVVDKITEGKDYDNAAISLKDVGSNFVLYNVSVKNSNGELVQPNGKVTISYPIPEDFDIDNIALYRINEDGTKTLISGVVEDGYYKVIQKSLDSCALVDTSVTDEPIAPDTADPANIFIWVLLAVASAVLLGIAVYDKKRKVN